MGKKRRLISAYKKFKAKHSTHPLILRNLDKDEELEIEELVVAKEEPVVAKEEPVVAKEEIVQKEKIEEPPKPKVRKKKTTRRRTIPKKVTKKENR